MRLLRRATWRPLTSTRTLTNKVVVPLPQPPSASADEAATAAAAAAAEGGGDAPSIGFSPNNKSHFPWRETESRQKAFGFWDKLGTSVRVALAAGLHEGPDVMELHDGFLQAFKHTSASIFRQDEAAFGDILDPALAAFYRDALAGVKSSQSSLHHELHEVGQTRLLDCEIIFYSKRDKSPSAFRHIVKEPFWLGTSRMDVAEPSRGDITFEEWAKKPEIKAALSTVLRMQHSSTMRYTFGIETSETFYVKDSAGVVIQGAEGPRRYHHEVILEYSHTRNANAAGPDIFVADIDRFLEGNKFWLQARAKNL